MQPRRSCGVVDDGYESRRRIMERLNRDRAIDDGSTIHIGVVFHIMYNVTNQSQLTKDINHTLNLLNKDFNKTPNNFNNGANVYTNQDLKSTYESYVKAPPRPR